MKDRRNESKTVTVYIDTVNIFLGDCDVEDMEEDLDALMEEVGTLEDPTEDVEDALDHQAS